MRRKLSSRKKSPKGYAEIFFSKTRDVFKELHLTPRDSPLAIMNANALAFLSLLPMLLPILTKEKNLNFLKEVIKEYRQLIKREFPGREIAYVETAAPLTEEEEAILNERLASIFGEYCRLEVEVKPELIGGLVVKIGDKVLDESVLGKIKELERHLNL